MKTSSITDQGNQMSVGLSGMYYRQATKEVLDAELNAGTTDVHVSQTFSMDMSRYEFPGDRTYERYLSNRLGVVK